MSQKPVFFKSKHCENMVELIFGDGKALSCCGEAMEEVRANTTEGAAEKHLPAVQVNGDRVTVSVGSIPHPMTAEHNIGWVYLETEQGGQRKLLKAGSEPVAEFALAGGDRPVAAYAWCNLHGFWKIDL